MHEIDAIALDFDPKGLMVLNVILALIMFGVALDLKPSDFKALFKDPKAGVVGLTAQLILLPLVTFGMTLILDLPPSVELGMILVAACPGGNFSNFLTSIAKGNTSLSISMTAVVTSLAIVSTPFQLAFWGGMNPTTEPILRRVSIDPVQMTMIVALIIALPVAIGMFVNARFEKIAAKMRKPFSIGSIVFLGIFIVIALSKNATPALEYIPTIGGLVILHNFIGLVLGRTCGWLARLAPADQRTLTIEVGIQNTGLGLVLTFSFFDGLGGMMVVAALYGVWHLISGLMLAFFWAKRPPVIAPEEASPA